jgi:general secretion pathway protein G
LVELLVVVAIIAMLAGLTLAALGGIQKRGARAKAETEVAALSAALDAYRLDFGAYPSSNNLVTELTGQGPVNERRVYIEPHGAMVSGGRFTDPWGAAYNYEPETPSRNVGFFDLWTTSGESSNTASWIWN